MAFKSRKWFHGTEFRECGEGVCSRSVGLRRDVIMLGCVTRVPIVATVKLVSEVSARGMW